MSLAARVATAFESWRDAPADPRPPGVAERTGAARIPPSRRRKAIASSDDMFDGLPGGGDGGGASAVGSASGPRPSPTEFASRQMALGADGGRDQPVSRRRGSGWAQTVRLAGRAASQSAFIPPMIWSRAPGKSLHENNLSSFCRGGG